MTTFPSDVDGWLSEAEGNALARLAAGRRVLEVGSYAGRSTICLAQSAEAVFCCDVFDGRATPHARNTLAELLGNLERYQVREKCTIHVGDHRIVLPSFREAQFDLAFIDGDHSHDAVTRDLEDCVATLKPGGILAFHDYQRDDNPGVTRAIDDWRGGRQPSVVDMLAWFELGAAPPPAWHVVMPFSRPENAERILRELDGQGVVWHPIIHQPLSFPALPWIRPFSVVPPAGKNPCYWKLNAFAQAGVASGDYYCFTCDDCLWEPGFWSKLKKHAGDVVICSQAAPNLGDALRVARPANMRHGQIDLSQITLRGRVYRDVRFGETSEGADGEMAEYLAPRYAVDYAPECVSYYNCLRPEAAGWTPPAPLSSYQGPVAANA